MMNGSSNPYKLSFSKLNESFRTGLVSPAQSTSVTPITPMTPLTTPRTPAQILLDRTERMKRSASIEPYEEEKQQQLALEMFTNFVDSIEGYLMEIADREYDGERVIGPGIVRMCRDLADRIEELAEEVKGGEEVYDLMLNEHDGDDESVEVIHEATSQDDSLEPGAVSSGAIYSILTDAAASLRSISQEEAQELAEVSLQVAMMAVWALRIVQSNMSRMLNSHTSAYHSGSRGISKDQETGASSTGRTVRVTWSNVDDATVISDNRSNRHNANRELGTLLELAGEEEKKDENYNSINVDKTTIAVNVVSDRNNNPPKDFESTFVPSLATNPASPCRSPSGSHPAVDSSGPGRCRVLWPPILPAIQEAGRHCIGQAQEHPLPATTIGLLCGPAAVTAAIVICPPVLIGDWAIQSSYNALSDTAFIETVEKAAANALQVTKLGILCSKLAIKQGMAVGEKQIQRRGGIHKICCDVVDVTVDRVMHPLETVCMAWNGLFWMGGLVGDAIGFVGEVVGGGAERMDIH